MGDEDEGDAHLLAQLVEERDHLRLDRNVERRHGLIADDQLRLERERPGNRDTLALAAGKLVWIAAHVLRPEPDWVKSSATRSRHLALGRMSGWMTQASEISW